MPRTVRSIRATWWTGSNALIMPMCGYTRALGLLPATKDCEPIGPFVHLLPARPPIKHASPSGLRDGVHHRADRVDPEVRVAGRRVVVVHGPSVVADRIGVDTVGRVGAVQDHFGTDREGLGTAAHDRGAPGAQDARCHPL